jgi:N-acetylglucosamine-6-sulfatase
LLPLLSHGYHLGLFRIGQGKQHQYDFDIRVPTFVRGPGITGGTSSARVGGNVDFAPTFLQLAGVDGAAMPPQIDGRSFADLLLPSPSPSPSSIVATVEGGEEKKPWRTTFLIEHYALRDWPEHYVPGVTRLNDCPANTYRALRVIEPTKRGNLMYVEMTLVHDWWFENINFRELYDLDRDPYQLRNIYNQSSQALRAELAQELRLYWHCAGSNCA